MFYKLDNNLIKKNSHNSINNLHQRTPFTQKNEDNLNQVTRFSTTLNSMINNNITNTSLIDATKSTNHQKESVNLLFF